MSAAQLSAFGQSSYTGEGSKGYFDSFSSNSVFTQHRTVVQGHCSSWMNSLRTRFDEITSLQIGWDGYNGLPVSFQSAQFAAIMLERLCKDSVPAPSVVPGSDGSLQVEWHRNGYDVEIDILGPNHVIASRYCHDTDSTQELILESDFTSVVPWINALAEF